MNNPEKAPVPGLVLWARTESLARVKAVLFLISGIVLAIAVEAIRVALVSALHGVTPAAFGIMPTRALSGFDVIFVILIGLAGIVYVGFNLSRTILDGLPLAIGLMAAGTPGGPGLAVAWDGLKKPQRNFNFSVIGEIDSIARGTMGSGGHQVRIRVQGRRLALTIARMETALEADQLVTRLIQERESATLHGSEPSEG